MSELWGTSEITDSLSKSILSDSADVIATIADLGLDAILNGGLLEEVPFLSTAVSVFKISSKVKFAHEVKKLAIFIVSINKNMADSDAVHEYKVKLKAKDKNIKIELEYLSVILERVLEYQKPEMLAKLYLAYINRQIDWNTFLAYSVVVGQIFVQDIPLLMQYKDQPGFLKGDVPDSAVVFRLFSLGLIEIVSGSSVYSVGSRIGVDINVYEHDYKHTSFGRVFANII